MMPVVPGIQVIGRDKQRGVLARAEVNGTSVMLSNVNPDGAEHLRLYGSNKITALLLRKGMHGRRAGECARNRAPCRQPVRLRVGLQQHFAIFKQQHNIARFHRHGIIQEGKTPYGAR